jgi:hypothetical protein
MSNDPRRLESEISDPHDMTAYFAAANAATAAENQAQKPSVAPGRNVLQAAFDEALRGGNPIIRDNQNPGKQRDVA